MTHHIINPDTLPIVIILATGLITGLVGGLITGLMHPRTPTPSRQ